jgi:anthranilate/para-aminobenzoate synthase component II
MVRTLLVDNYDSFTYNLYALLTAVNGAEPTVIRNDSHWDALDFGRFDTSLSPRGREPRRRAMISALAPVSSPSRDRPLLGVCLGHQGLCSMWGRASSGPPNRCTVGPQPSCTPARICLVGCRHRLWRCTITRW